MRFQSLIRTGLAIHLLLGAAACSHAAPPVEAAGNYQLVDLGACKQPPLAAPAVPKESYERYAFRRRFVDLDGSGNCVLMEFWIERQGGSAAAGMRTLEHRFLRAVGGKWEAFETELKYFPHALKDRRDNKIYVIEAPTVDDVGDAMVLPADGPRVFKSAGWQQEAGFAAELKLEPVDDRRAELLQALAALLEQRPAAAKEKGAEQARIRMLRAQAKSTL